MIIFTIIIYLSPPARSRLWLTCVTLPCMVHSFTVQQRLPLTPPYWKISPWSRASRTVLYSDLSPEPTSILHRHSRGFCRVLIFLEFSRMQLPCKSREMGSGVFPRIVHCLENHITHRSALSHQQNTPTSVCICNCIHCDLLFIGVGDRTALTAFRGLRPRYSQTEVHVGVLPIVFFLFLLCI